MGGDLKDRPSNPIVAKRGECPIGVILCSDGLLDPEEVIPMWSSLQGGACASLARRGPSPALQVHKGTVESLMRVACFVLDLYKGRIKCLMHSGHDCNIKSILMILSFLCVQAHPCALSVQSEPSPSAPAQVHQGVRACPSI